MCPKLYGFIFSTLNVQTNELRQREEFKWRAKIIINHEISRCFITSNCVPQPHPHNDDIVIIPCNEYCQSDHMTVFLAIIYVYKGSLMVRIRLLLWGKKMDKKTWGGMGKDQIHNTERLTSLQGVKYRNSLRVFWLFFFLSFLLL